MNKRPMSGKEREFLAQILKGAATGATRWIRGSENALILWALSMLVFVFAWKFIAWLARITLRVEIGWTSPAAVWIAVIGFLACVVIAVISSVRWIKKWGDIRPDIRADLEGGQVDEESYEFTAARRFQEPEHGGLIYFLRTPNDKVFVLFDYESQDLGAGGENPLNSKFQPCTGLLIVRAPKSQLVISKEFSSAPLDAGDPQELSIPPESWPESETYCEIPWDELQTRLSRRDAKAR